MCFEPTWENRSLSCNDSGHAFVTNGGSIVPCGTALNAGDCPNTLRAAPTPHFYEAACPYCFGQQAMQEALNEVQNAAQGTLVSMMQVQSVMGATLNRMSIHPPGGYQSQQPPLPLNSEPLAVDQASLPVQHNPSAPAEVQQRPPEQASGEMQVPTQGPAQESAQVSAPGISLSKESSHTQSSNSETHESDSKPQRLRISRSKGEEIPGEDSKVELVKV